MGRIYLCAPTRVGGIFLSLKKISEELLIIDFLVNMLLVDKFLSTGIWSTDYCRNIFVDTTLRRNFFVDANIQKSKSC
jgi:hypothetical protein